MRAMHDGNASIRERARYFALRQQRLPWDVYVTTRAVLAIDHADASPRDAAMVADSDTATKRAFQRATGILTGELLPGEVDDGNALFASASLSMGPA